uniref:Uncharacterized protein n=1 Tax=Chromera velia CCMP2878 TaxID=1169474 RepID=A0A0G4FJQ5_9ALVE|eukprot:Cvel_17398.t1-p1 / transcript=Cvel_17398.t1 / gene=Cvel_17398 / organism=Chromera_velia_CCMP2878 / gene_product=hypothetical protein / transcript_product=hypothetical protein / location=Cvel_scaffold1385:10483-19133(-) / protein_length=1441 / sequence_SO=supercontig / SO=protein_coding / is_pseudo=false
MSSIGRMLGVSKRKNKVKKDKEDEPKTVEEWRKKVHQLEAENEALDEELQGLQGTAEGNKAALQEQITRNNELQKEVESLRPKARKLAEIDSELEMLRIEKEQLKGTIEADRKKLADEERQRQQHLEQIQSLQTRLIAAEKGAAAGGGAAAGAVVGGGGSSERVRQLEAENEELQENLKKLEQEVYDLTDMLLDKEEGGGEEGSSPRERISAAKQKAAQQMTARSQQSDPGIVIALQEGVARRDAELSDLRARLHREEKERTALEEEKAGLEVKLAALAASAGSGVGGGLAEELRLKAETDGLRRVVGELKREAETARQERQKAETENVKLKHEVAKLKEGAETRDAGGPGLSRGGAGGGGAFAGLAQSHQPSEGGASSLRELAARNRGAGPGVKGNEGLLEVNERLERKVAEREAKVQELEWLVSRQQQQLAASIVTQAELESGHATGLLDAEVKRQRVEVEAKDRALRLLAVEAEKERRERERVEREKAVLQRKLKDYVGVTENPALGGTEQLLDRAGVQRLIERTKEVESVLDRSVREKREAERRASHAETELQQRVQEISSLRSSLQSAEGRVDAVAGRREREEKEYVKMLSTNAELVEEMQMRQHDSTAVHRAELLACCAEIRRLRTALAKADPISHGHEAVRPETGQGGTSEKILDELMKMYDLKGKDRTGRRKKTEVPAEAARGWFYAAKRREKRALREYVTNQGPFPSPTSPASLSPSHSRPAVPLSTSPARSAGAASRFATLRASETEEERERDRVALYGGGGTPGEEEGAARDREREREKMRDELYGSRSVSLSPAPIASLPNNHEDAAQTPSLDKSASPKKTAASPKGKAKAKAKHIGAAGAAATSASPSAKKQLTQPKAKTSPPKPASVSENGSGSLTPALGLGVSLTSPYAGGSPSSSPQAGEAESRHWVTGGESGGRENSGTSGDQTSIRVNQSPDTRPASATAFAISAAVASQPPTVTVNPQPQHRDSEVQQIEIERWGSAGSPTFDGSPNDEAFTLTNKMLFPSSSADVTTGAARFGTSNSPMPEKSGGVEADYGYVQAGRADNEDAEGGLNSSGSTGRFGRRTVDGDAIFGSVATRSAGDSRWKNSGDEMEMTTGEEEKEEAKERTSFGGADRYSFGAGGTAGAAAIAAAAAASSHREGGSLPQLPSDSHTGSYSSPTDIESLLAVVGVTDPHRGKGAGQQTQQQRQGESDGSSSLSPDIMGGASASLSPSPSSGRPGPSVGRGMSSEGEQEPQAQGAPVRKESSEMSSIGKLLAGAGGRRDSDSLGGGSGLGRGDHYSPALPVGLSSSVSASSPRDGSGVGGRPSATSGSGTAPADEAEALRILSELPPLPDFPRRGSNPFKKAGGGGSGSASGRGGPPGGASASPGGGGVGSLPFHDSSSDDVSLPLPLPGGSASGSASASRSAASGSEGRRRRHREAANFT